MKKILFITPPELGHFYSTAGIGAELIARGHQAIWLSSLSLPVPDKGQMLLPEKTLSQDPEGMAWLNNWSQILRQANSDNYTQLMGQFFTGETTINLVKEYSEIIKQLAPDVVVVDSVSQLGGPAASLAKFAFITHWATPFEFIKLQKSHDTITDQYRNFGLRLQELVGLRKDKYLMHSKQLNLIPGSKELIGWYDWPSTFELVSPIFHGRKIETTFNWQKLKNNPQKKLLVSLGTLLDSEAKDFFTIVAAALGNQDITVVASAEPNLLPHWPDNFVVNRHLPQLELLPHMHGIIFHGGYNTAIESLYHYLPVIILPRAHDQFAVASQLTEAGCGIRLRLKRLNGKALMNSVSQLLTEQSYANQARQIGKSLRDLNNNPVDLLLQF